MWKLWGALLALLVVGIYGVATSKPTWAHGTLSWAADYKSASGVPCCIGPSEHSEGDCAEVSEAVASTVRLGGTVRVAFPSGERVVRINKIFASPDPHAPRVICSPGCAFMGAGV